VHRLVLLRKMQWEMEVICKHAVAQEKAFEREIERAKRHRKRQEEEMFSVAFGGVLGVDSMGFAHGGRVLTGESAVAEFEGVKATRCGRVG
jgi:hypothetical protein